MKKAIVIILITLLACNISGAGISYHYCGDFFQSLSINFKAPKTKCCCGDAHKNKKNSEEKKNCCETKHKTVTVDESKTLAKQLVLKIFFEIAAAIPPTFSFSEILPGAIVATQFVTSPTTTPPFVRPVRIHILHQRFLI